MLLVNSFKVVRYFRNFILLTFIATVFIIFEKEVLQKINTNGGVRKKTADDSTDHQNYFLGADRLAEMGLLINTSSCQIPDFSQWDPEIIHLIGKAAPFPGCMSYNWSHMNGNVLTVQEENMNQDGFSFQNGSCCYKIIQRIQQPKNNYTTKADNLISYSTCIPITQIKTEINEEFIIVECSLTKLFGVVYRGFHANANFNLASSKNVNAKIKHWKKRTTKEKEKDLPPNILIIGIDSTSRNNFRRNMFKTLRRLENMEAVEMLGFTKVGENTFPNFCPIMHGYSEEELIDICYFTKSTKQDDCPFVWKRFDAANYLTAHTEDSPKYTTFNYMKTGFVEQPVDFYARPIFLAADEYKYSVKISDLRFASLKLKMNEPTSEEMCLGYSTADEMILQYLKSTLDFASKHKSPIFTLSWATGVSHDDPKGIQLTDQLYSDFLGKLEQEGYLNNTILFFMGDHGYRFGPWRETLIGYYEDKLPNMWIKLPPRIQKEFPHWQKALEINKRRLTSPYALYWTLNLILETFSSTKSPEDAVNFKTGKPIVRKHRYTFFDPIPEEASCENLGVPDTYCACCPLTNVKLDNPVLISAANEAANIIYTENLSSSEKCSQFKVSNIIAGAVIDKTLENGMKRYVVSFVTAPGAYLFEAEIDYFPRNKTFSRRNVNVHRASKINQEYIRCIKDPNLELFCYCNQT